MLGSMLSIKPVITVKDGAVEPVGKVRTRSKALRFVVDRVKERPVESLCVLHAQAPDVDDFVAMLEPIVPQSEIVVGEIGPVVGVHTGPAHDRRHLARGARRHVDGRALDATRVA